MVTVYEIKIKLVSPWVNLDELSMKDIFMNFLKKFKHPVFKNLKFENIEIDVIRK
ncbi:hypothetical protein M0Q97_11510 [Candidatus Dojkabacteria bacterium]|jgi:hypothetical protein|nr:hypothetical protein [Candidatus Dojkabacteria bacterium]